MSRSPMPRRLDRGAPAGVRKFADVRLYSGRRAKASGLVDSFGGLAKAEEPTLSESLLSGVAPRPSEAGRLMDASNLDLEAKPYYLYFPGA